MCPLEPGVRRRCGTRFPMSAWQLMCLRIKDDSEFPILLPLSPKCWKTGLQQASGVSDHRVSSHEDGPELADANPAKEEMFRSPVWTQEAKNRLFTAKRGGQLDLPHAELNPPVEAELPASLAPSLFLHDGTCVSQTKPFHTPLLKAHGKEMETPLPV